MLGEGLEGVGGEEGVVALPGDEEAAHQVVELLLVDFLLRALSDDAARSDVIQPVEHLGGVALHLVGVDSVEGLDGLFLQTHIIIIGGVDDGVLALGIVQTAQLSGRELTALLVDAVQCLVGQLTVLMELTITRTALTKPHVLHVGHHPLHLVVARLQHFIQQHLSIVVLHADDTDEGLVVTCLRPTLAVTVAQFIGPDGISLGRVDVAVMISIREGIQLVHGAPVWA